MNRKRTSLACLASLFCLAAVDAPPANAQAFGYLHVRTESDVTAGLDAPTRELIGRLPAELRAQVLQLLKDSLPLIDKSVNGYLDRAGVIINETINNASCAATAVVYNAIGEISSKIGANRRRRSWTFKNSMRIARRASNPGPYSTSVSNMRTF